MFGYFCSVVFLVFGGISFYFSGSIQGFSFDPIGSSLFPRTISALLVLFSFLAIVEMIIKKESRLGVSWKVLGTVLLIMLLIFLYILATFVYRIPFSISTLVLVFVVSFLVSEKYSRKIFCYSILIGAVVGISCEYLFTEFFFVDLPVIWRLYV